ncbi:MAG: metal-sensing transcriptional repressor [Verrucomicrobia bacterium]|nr:metal-sensing transcriptional repressor [Verrucomicrobiota bacterium]
MAHVIQNKKKLLARINRIRGQINAVEKALNEERDCGEVLLTLASGYRILCTLRRIARELYSRRRAPCD